MSDQSTPRSTGSVDPDRLAALLGAWSAGAHGTLAQQLGVALRDAIRSGLVVDGTRLPSERALASALAVSRATVTTALDELRADGLLVSRQGSGTVVRSRPAGAIVGTRIAEHFGPTGAIDLAAGNPPDAGHLPPIQVDVAALLAAGEGPGVQPLGLPALRAALAAHHSEHGRLTDADQIHVTSGAHHAISLLVTALAGAGDPVAVEDTAYPGIFDVVDALGAVAVPIRTDHHGIVPDALDHLLREERPRVLYVQSGPHNPTGRLPSPIRLRELAEVLDRHDATVIEDGALAELTFAGRQRPELADLCRRAVVVSVGSFSKVAWGGLRVGWLRGPAPLVERTMYLRLNHDLGTSIPSQLLALQLLPHMEELAARRRAELAERVDRSLELLAELLPEWSIRAPEGGSVLWATLPVDDAASYVRLAGRHGVHVAPGSIAVPGRAPDPHVRICVDRPWPHVEEGIRRLRFAWRDLTAGPGVVLG
ncbi:aminotransferase-like domain-containing protein [Actinomarinicola tropica]|uniref:aminotransferase-like domain-containing protein n=1 Tax=Actinomarinicola tropica TaxID=2789776 RepID=UPI001899C213|nr:PLP-dependent aminotransferase family protein [Actinomarinicola tropica]